MHSRASPQKVWLCRELAARVPLQMKASHFEGLITTILGYVLLAGALIFCHVSFNLLWGEWEGGLAVVLRGAPPHGPRAAPGASLLDLNFPLLRLWPPW